MERFLNDRFVRVKDTNSNCDFHFIHSTQVINEFTRLFFAVGKLSSLFYVYAKVKTSMSKMNEFP